MADKATETPLMKQYYSFKAKYPDAMLLFRVGDFYETYGEDAVKSSEILGIVLTKRSSAIADSVELAGFPHHALDTYLPKLVRAGLKVAVCEQLEDPKLAKKLVKRGVVELVTPGVTYSDSVLEQKENNFLASVHLEKRFRVWLSWMFRQVNSISPKATMNTSTSCCRALILRKYSYNAINARISSTYSARSIT